MDRRRCLNSLISPIATDCFDLIPLRSALDLFLVLDGTMEVSLEGLTRPVLCRSKYDSVFD